MDAVPVEGLLDASLEGYLPMDALRINPDQPLEPAPEQTAFDYSLAIAKVSTIVFPFFGTAITLLDLVTAPMRGKRLSDWCEGIRLQSMNIAEN